MLLNVVYACVECLTSEVDVVLLPLRVSQIIEVLVGESVLPLDISEHALQVPERIEQVEDVPETVPNILDVKHDGVAAFSTQVDLALRAKLKHHLAAEDNGVHEGDGEVKRQVEHEENVNEHA